ncbi:Imm10 family immunity protein [Streptomyces sp. NPDC054770]
MELTIREINQDEEYKTYTLALFTSWGEGVQGFEFQRNLRGSEDRHAPRPPFDSYCVVNESHKTSFGGVKSVELRDALLKISFSEKAQEELGLPAPVVSLFLDLSRDEIEKVKAGLVYVFSYGSAELLPEIIGLSADR